jgi:hypothetical protein
LFAAGQYKLQQAAIPQMRRLLRLLTIAYPQATASFPFTFWGGTELRPMQPYLNKLPAELAGLFPQLTSAAAAAMAPPAIPRPPGLPRQGSAPHTGKRK